MNTEQTHHSDRFQLGRKANPQSIRRAAVNFNKLLDVHLTTATAEVSINRLELLSELENKFGLVACVLHREDPLRFVATIPLATLGSWRDAGTGVSMGVTRQVLRVWMSFDEQPTETFRDMAVTLSNRSEQIDDGRGRRMKRTALIQGSV